jgi:hypothetical protein
MSAKRNSNYLPPCPDPEKYILVRTKEGEFWRRKRGTVKPARLNLVFAQNVSNSKVASPAAKRIIQKLRPWLQDLNTGRLTARLAGLLIKTINLKGYADFSLLKGFEFQHPPLRSLLRAGVTVVVKDSCIMLSISLLAGSMARRGDLVTDFYFEAILVYGDLTADNGLRVDSTISRLYSFEEEGGFVCELELDLPEGAWMVILKVVCQEENKPSVNAGQFGMRVVEVGERKTKELDSNQ